MEDTTLPVDNESVRVISTADVLRVYRLLEEMNRFLHQPLNCSGYLRACMRNCTMCITT